MRKKHVVIALFFILTALILTGCAQSGSDATTSPDPQGTELVLTLEELAQYDGKNGNPAYVAVDGVIYDMTDSAPWKDGEHNGFSAGQDLTDAIKNVSPHGVSKLTNVPVVGRLAE